MKALTQDFLLWLFPKIRKTGIWETRLGQATYFFAYKIYKTIIETGDVRTLGILVRPGSTVLYQLAKRIIDVPNPVARWT